LKPRARQWRLLEETLLFSLFFLVQKPVE